MTRFPHDEFAKGCFESLLSPLGVVQTSLKIGSEVREIDIYFQPNSPIEPTPDLGLLGQLVTMNVAFEPFRNSVKVPQIRSCMSKLFDLHGYQIREAKRLAQPEPSEESLPCLWILTPTLSDKILASGGASLDLERWGDGVYSMHPILKTGIIVIHQLPKTPETLWFRLLGKGKVQSQAIDEVNTLPPDNPYRQNALNLLGNLTVILESRDNIEPEDRELLMQLSPLYLEKLRAAEEVGEARGEARVIVRQLSRRFGSVPDRFLTQIQQLTIPQLDELGDALLDFTSVEDLAGWFSRD
jgi:Domain of unknown function (DUF4351)